MKLNKTHKAAGILNVLFHDVKMDAYICECDPNLLIADQDYQRPHDEKHSDRMKSKNMLVWGYPIVSFRAGKARIVEGQHRTESFKKKGNNTIYALVKFNLSKSQEADQYAELNTMKRPNAWNQFKARLTSGNAKYRNMQRIATDAGFTLLCDDKNADLRNTNIMLEAYDCGLFADWVQLLTAFTIRDDGKLDRAISRNSIELQRGLLDLRRSQGETIVNNRVLRALREIGADLIHREATRRCDCKPRPNRSDYHEVLKGLLLGRGLARAA